MIELIDVRCYASVVEKSNVIEYGFHFYIYALTIPLVTNSPLQLSISVRFNPSLFIFPYGLHLILSFTFLYLFLSPFLIAINLPHLFFSHCYSTLSLDPTITALLLMLLLTTVPFFHPSRTSCELMKLRLAMVVHVMVAHYRG